MDLEQRRNQFALAAYDIVRAKVLRRAGGDVHAADDLTQEAFLAALRPGFDPARPDAIGFVAQAGLWAAEDRRRRLRRAPQALSAEPADRRVTGPLRALERQEEHALACG